MYLRMAYLLELMLAFLTFGDKRVLTVLAWPFLRPNLLQYVQNFQWVQNSILPNGKHVAIIIH